jgi:hypothetical protein
LVDNVIEISTNLPNVIEDINTLKDLYDSPTVDQLEHSNNKYYMCALAVVTILVIGYFSYPYIIDYFYPKPSGDPDLPKPSDFNTRDILEVDSSSVDSTISRSNSTSSGVSRSSIPASCGRSGRENYQLCLVIGTNNTFI